MNNNFVKEIKKINDIINCNVSLKNYNTMKLECKAKYLIKPGNFIELKKVMEIINKYKKKYILIGNGSNILFTDKDKEVIIKLNFKKNKNRHILMGNELLPIVSNEFYNNGYSGLETLCMIPASVGGAIVMNAGAYGSSISDIIEFVYVLDEDNNFKVLNKEKCKFAYRESIFKNNKMIVLGCKVKLKKDNKDSIKEKMNYVKEKRKESQPLEYFNSGSIFKNPDGYKAWELISYLNLKGIRKNNAMISDKHCNFIVNLNNAKYEDIKFLIDLVKRKVKDKFYVKLEEEVIIID